MNWIVAGLGLVVFGILVYIYRTQEMGDNKKAQPGQK